MTTRFELIVACGFLVLILFGLHQTYQIDLAFSSDLETFSGPRAYPGLILGLTLAMTLGVLASLLLSPRPASGDDAAPLFHRGTLKAIWVLAALAGFVLLLEPVGYLLTMVPLLMVTARMNGARRWLTAAMVSILMALACLAVFRYGLNTVLPEGVLGIDAIL